jgi:hypothetical protein
MVRLQVEESMPLVPESSARWPSERWVLAAVLLIATLLRMHGFFHDLPYSFHGDEMHFVKRSLALGTGDLNPHWFHKPAFLMYLLAFCYGIYYLIGAALGNFASVDTFAAHCLANHGDLVVIGRTLVVAFGIATVYLVYKIGRNAFGGRTTGLVAALTAAVLPPMVAASQTVKADVPAGFFVALALYAYLRTRQDGRLRWLVLASAFAGVAMGTKYYGVILLPTFGVFELTRRFLNGTPWRVVLARVGLVAAVFVGAFFLSSPYNFLDPTWGRNVIAKVGAFISPEATERFDPDEQVVYTPGTSAVPGAATHFLGKVVSPQAFGLPFAVLALLGLALTLSMKRTRLQALVIAMPIPVFMLVAVTVSAYHTNARHLNALYPYLCVFVYPGGVLLARLLRFEGARRTVVAITLCCIAAVPSVSLTLNRNLHINRPDSRQAATLWIQSNLCGDSRILLDDYGPILLPNSAAIERLRARLANLPEKEAFTKHQSRRLDLLSRFPPTYAFDVTELGHPWWLNREVPQEELLGAWKHRDMGNPLCDRIPRSLEEYRDSGIRYVVTNSRAQRRYLDREQTRAAFPSFVRFYERLRGLEPTKVFDPAPWGAKGPTIWIYDLRDGRSRHD